MNYLKQLLAFYDELEINPLNSSEIALWHALMSINNKTAWSDTFTVASSVLRQRSGLKVANFFKTRNTLAQKGYITWNSTGSNKAAKYQIKPLYNSLSTNSVDTSIGSSRDTSIGSHIDTSRALTKQKQKTNKTETSPPVTEDDAYRNLISVIQQNFGINSTRPLMQDDLRMLISDFTEQGTTYFEAIDIFKYAVQIAVTHNAESWSYVKGIINKWEVNSLFDMSRIKDYQKRSDRPKKKSYGQKKPSETATNWEIVKPNKTSESSYELQKRLAKIRGEKSAT